jgi:dolichol kinase
MSEYYVKVPNCERERERKRGILKGFWRRIVNVFCLIFLFYFKFLFNFIFILGVGQLEE